MENTIDDMDKGILALLQEDARLTNKEIAARLGRSLTPIYERIKRLERDGYIKKYVALLDNTKINKGLVAYTQVQLKEHAQAILRNFEKQAVQLNEVMECYHMTGQFDFLLKVAVSNMGAYHDFMINKLARLPNIATVQSYFVMAESKLETAYPLDLKKK